MERKLFFSQKFQVEFNWRGKYSLRAGTVRPNNKDQISAALRDMSSESIRNRFLASKREFSDKELHYLSHLDGNDHYAIGIEERDPDGRGVAIIRLVRSEEIKTEAEVAITIIDQYQKMGLGSLLMDLIILAAIERGIETLSFSFLSHNIGIEKLIRSYGPFIRGPMNKDYVQLFLEIKKLDLNEIKSQLAQFLPKIDSFHLEI
jgi:GNAT superfamily N-acetyltransferase